MKVSVITPAYNAAKFIVKALDSVSSQTFPVREIVVVDDGSSDDTRELVRTWMDAWCVPVKLQSQANAGVSVARNTAINFASGEWVAFLDADDIWLPNHVEDLMAAAKSYPQALTVFGDAIQFTQEGDEYPYFSREKSLKCAIKRQGDYHLLDAEAFFAGTVPGLFLCPSASMVKRRVALANGGFDASILYIEDRDFFLRMALQGPIAFVDRSISRKRVHDSNITHPRNTQRNAFYMIKLLRKMQDSAGRVGLKDSQVNLLNQTLDQTVRGYLYGASENGMRSYWQAINALVGFSIFPAARFNPRNLARSMVGSVKSTQKAG